MSINVKLNEGNFFPLQCRLLLLDRVKEDE